MPIMEPALAGSTLEPSHYHRRLPLLAITILRSASMKKVVWGLVALLFILHQDVWFWTDDTLIFGFLPIGLAYHAGLSVAAAVTWFLAVKFAWPAELDDCPGESAGAQS